MCHIVCKSRVLPNLQVRSNLGKAFTCRENQEANQNVLVRPPTTERTPAEPAPSTHIRRRCPRNDQRNYRQLPRSHLFLPVGRIGKLIFTYRTDSVRRFTSLPNASPINGGFDTVRRQMETGLSHWSSWPSGDYSSSGPLWSLLAFLGSREHQMAWSGAESA